MGLAASGLVLANGSDTVSPAAGATSFVFATAVATGSSYAVTIKTQPDNEPCQVASGSGQVASAAVTNVMVTCGHPWTWVSGANTIGATGVYGTQGTAAAGTVPGARAWAVSWTDSTANLWLFGGTPTPRNAIDTFNDLWRYSPGSGQWTWVAGSNTVESKGVYGTRGVAAAGNVPGARWFSVSWIDSAGDLWLFGGGEGSTSAGISGELNDLWRYSPSSGQWTWVSGSSASDAQGVYGTQGMAAAGNMPGARFDSVSWTDSAGNMWLFGGSGFDSAGTSGALNDVWRYSPGSDQWTWVSGSNTVSATGVYGTLGVAAAGNVPGARSGSVAWFDSAGDLWLLGGVGLDSAGTLGYLNDLWRYTPGGGQWTWVGGSTTVNPKGVYGTLGVAAAGNVPGARSGSVVWLDNAGKLWLFGGLGYDSTGTGSVLNDLWVY